MPDEIEGGAGLVAPVLVPDPVGVDVVLRGENFGAPLEGALDAFVDRHGGRLRANVVGGDDRDRVLCGLEVQQPLQPVLGVPDQAFRDDDVLFRFRDPDLGLNDVDGRERADVDLDLRDPVEVGGERAGLLLHLEVLERVDQVPVRLVDRVDRALHAPDERLVRGVPIVAGRPDEPRRGIASAIAEKRLGQRQRQARVVGRVDEEERRVGRGPVAGEAERESSAGRRELRHARREVGCVARGHLGARELRGRRLLVVRADEGRFGQRVEDPRVREENVSGGLGGVDRDVQVLVVRHRESDRVGEREADSLGVCFRQRPRRALSRPRRNDARLLRDRGERQAEHSGRQQDGAGRPGFREPLHSVTPSSP